MTNFRIPTIRDPRVKPEDDREFPRDPPEGLRDDIVRNSRFREF